MPDQDKFERRLRGKGWRKFYRLAGGNAPLPALVDSLMAAVAHGLRNGVSCSSVPRISRSLFACLRPEGAQMGLFPAADSFGRLHRQLDRIRDDELGCLGTRIAAKAGEEVYLELRQRSQVAERDIESRLSERFVERLIDHLCLSRVRDGIAEENRRSVEEQAAWEETLLSRVRPQARRFLKRLFESGHTFNARAPGRLAATRETTAELLHTPLGVL